MSIFGRLWKRPQSIYDCCRLLCHIQFFLGCSGIRSYSDVYLCDWMSLTYTFVAVVSNVSALLVTAYVKFQDPYFVDMDSLIKSIIYLELGMSLLMYVVTTTTMVARVRTHLDLYKRLNDLDRVLVLEFGCDMNYGVLIQKHLLFLLFTTTIFVTIIALGVSRATHLQDLVINLLAGLAYSFVSGGPHLNFYIQMSLAEVLTVRFRLLQKLLMVKIPGGSVAEETRRRHRLQKLIDLVQQYHDCIRLTNRIYSRSLVTIMLHDFTLTTSELYLIFGGLTGSGSSVLIYFVLLGLVLPIYKMSVGPWYSENSITEVSGVVT